MLYPTLFYNRISGHIRSNFLECFCDCKDVSGMDTNTTVIKSNVSQHAKKEMMAAFQKELNLLYSC
jgi:hypothetical protein